MSVEQDVTDLVKRYIDAFNAQRFEDAMACYRLPFTWLFGDRAVTAGSADEFLQLMHASWRDLGRKGLAASELVEVTVRPLGDNLALAGVEVARMRQDGTEIARLGGSYLVHLGADGWRLVTYGSHPLSAIVPAGT